MCIAKTTCLSEYESKKFLRKYDIPLAAETLAKCVDDALSFAEKVGYPLVMKVDSPDIPHKTEAGVVKLNINNALDVKKTYDELLQKARAYNPNAVINGVLVQEMVTGGTEVIIGLKNDPQFGPIIMFGLGGIFVEVMKDVSLRIAPVTKSEAMDMIEEIKGSRILKGVRGRVQSDIDALADTLVKVSQLAIVNQDKIEEMDMNPVIVLPEGKGVKVVDALIILNSEECN